MAWMDILLVSFRINVGLLAHLMELEKIPWVEFDHMSQMEDITVSFSNVEDLHGR